MEGAVDYRARHKEGGVAYAIDRSLDWARCLEKQSLRFGATKSVLSRWRYLITTRVKEYRGSTSRKIRDISLLATVFSRHPAFGGKDSTVSEILS